MLAEHGAPDGTVALSDLQTSGRGRQGKSWASPAGGGIWFSLVLRPAADPEPRPAWLVAAIALAVAEAVEAETGVRALLRWPNDLVVEGRKLAGILLETRDYEPRAPLLVLGVGVNTDLAPADFPEDLREEATSLRILTGKAPDRTALLAAILSSVEGRLGRLAAGEGAEVEAAFAARAAFLGEPVTVFEGMDRRAGVLEEVSLREGLLLREAGGRTRRIRTEHARELRYGGGPTRGDPS